MTNNALIQFYEGETTRLEVHKGGGIKEMGVIY